MAKSKRAKQGTGHNLLTFLALWIFGHGLGWGLFLAMWYNMGLIRSNEFMEYGSFALVVGGITSIAQSALIKRQFGVMIKAWLPVSNISWFIAGLLLFPLAVQYFPDSQLGTGLKVLAIYGPAVLAQTVLLRRHVHNAWLWLLATVAGVMSFALPVVGSGDDGILLGSVLYACVTALTLVWLFKSPREVTKKQVETSEQLSVLDRTPEDKNDLTQTLFNEQSDIQRM